MRQTQLHWDPHIPQHYQPSNYTNRSGQQDQHHVSRQTQPHWDPQLRQQGQPHNSPDQWAFSQPPSQIWHRHNYNECNPTYSQQRHNANQRYPPSQQDASGQHRQYGQTQHHHSDRQHSR